MSQQLQSVGPVSCAKVLAVLYGAVGLLMGAIFFLAFSVAGIFGSSSQISENAGPLRFVLGAGSIVFFPICYAILGAIGGLIVAWLYNVIAKYTGGIEIELR
jgi:Transmembrane domain of unknown function (DUF3566)